MSGRFMDCFLNWCLNINRACLSMQGEAVVMVVWSFRSRIRVVLHK